MNKTLAYFVSCILSAAVQTPAYAAITYAGNQSDKVTIEAGDQKISLKAPGASVVATEGPQSLQLAFKTPGEITTEVEITGKDAPVQSQTDEGLILTWPSLQLKLKPAANRFYGTKIHSASFFGPKKSTVKIQIAQYDDTETVLSITETNPQ